MCAKDIRWHQRFQNYMKALRQMGRFFQQDQLNELEEQGLIKAFEYTYELSWHVLRDYMQYQGNTQLHGSRDTFREAFNLGLISEGERWMQMLQDRNLTVHTYNQETAQKIVDNIRQSYFSMFLQLQNTLAFLKDKEG
jgi:nucleotidyltransferase substrate binding protein (TIGR01987 family)